MRGPGADAVARVVVLAGPSGSGKSRLADRLATKRGWPVLRLDDFYKEGGDPTLPLLALAGGEPIVDWDHPGSWNAAAALAAIEELCRRGTAPVPVYDLASSSRAGVRTLDLGGSAYVVAEGIFAQEVVAPCRDRGLLVEAICVTQHPATTFLRRLVRDLREHRKPPWVLVRRGLHLMLAQRTLVGETVRRGCRVCSPEEAYREIRRVTGLPG